MRKFLGKEKLRSFAIAWARRRLRCVFVLSTGRVGTDTLMRLLSLAPKIGAEHEPFPQLLSETKQAYQDRKFDTEAARNYLNARLFAEQKNCLGRCLRQRLVYVETSNRLTYIAPSLSQFFPHSMFIYLYRNPTDIVRSGMRRNYYTGHPWDLYRITPRRDDPFVNRWNSWSSFEKCCWYWKAVNEFSLEFLKFLLPERQFLLPSEVLFNQDFDKLQELFEWIGAKAPGRSEMSEVLSVHHNEQQEGDFPKWPEWKSDLRMCMTEIIRPVALELGYEEYVDPECN